MKGSGLAMHDNELEKDAREVRVFQPKSAGVKRR